MTHRGTRRRATFAISGLKGPEDALLLGKCLASCPGIQRVDVRWEIRAVKVEFDEEIVSAQAIARRIATSDVHPDTKALVATLMLKVPSVRNEEKARLPALILRRLPGVLSVSSQIAAQAVEVIFAEEGDLKTGDLIDALKTEGIIANLM